MKQSIGHYRSIGLTLSAKSAGWTCFFLLFLLLTVRGTESELPVSVTLDLPIVPHEPVPSWLGQPETPPTTFATLNLPILTPNPNASLLVTVYFQEKEGGFMRVVWKGTQSAQLLSDNFYEDIGMDNQRSLLISPASLVGDGTLTFQCGDSNLGIKRIKLEWLESKTELVSPDVQDQLVTSNSGVTQPAQNLNGQCNPESPAAWDGQIVTVPISGQAVRVEQGVEFSIDLDKVPGSARLAFKEAGLPLGHHLVVWINQARAGTITPSVPDLLDEGFLTDLAASTSYIGWRDGSFYVPVSLLKQGVNTLQFSDEDDGAATSGKVAASVETPLAIKTLDMQLNYQSTQSLPQPQLSTTPTPPISPAQLLPTASNIPTP